MVRFCPQMSNPIVNGTLIPSVALVITTGLVSAARADFEIRLLPPRGTAAGAPSASLPARSVVSPAPPRRASPMTQGGFRGLPMAGVPVSPFQRKPIQIGVQRRGGPPVLPPVGRNTGPSSFGEGEGPLEAASLPKSGAQVPIQARLGAIIGGSVDVYRLPDARSQRIGMLKQGQQVAVVNGGLGWYCLVMGDGSQGYVPQTHLELLPYQVTAVTPTAPLPDAPMPTPSIGAAGLPMGVTPLSRAVLGEAYRYQETPYVYGGNTERGIDCSGLVKNCFALAGISLPRRASEQALVGAEVPLNQLQPGDRLYFSVRHHHDHTGIYVGNGYFIHASSARGKVAVDHLSTALYARSLDAARR